MAIASSFASSYALGCSTTFAVLLHEVPHELGDYAMLMAGGYTASQAIRMQLVTAIGAFAGAFFGLAYGGSEGGGEWMLPFTAGGFIYVACANVLPTLLEPVDNEDGKRNSPLRELCDVVSHVIAMASGVAMMAVIAAFE